jgi:hypothetical protein
VFKFIDINGTKHAAEYLNSSKVKYDDDVIDTYILHILTFKNMIKVFVVRGHSDNIVN